jgi:glyoxylase-like metal-dependent hydrolase (beta-lactamase superfamily II)
LFAPEAPAGTPPVVAVRCHILDTGYCLASERHLIRGGRRQSVRCHALVALLEHPAHGWLLWDTGYAPRIWDATARLPYRLYRRATPLRLDPDLALARQLSHFGLAPGDIGHVVLSHFHADHLAGLRDFPQATLVAAREAFRDVTGRRGWSALRRAFLPDLLPGGDVAARAHLLPDPFTDEPLPHLGPTHDLFGDGALRLVRLPGHARGQLGLLAQTERRGPLFFVADACYLTRSIRENRPPHPATNLFADDGRAVRDTLARLHRFAQARPDVTFVPTHCPEAFAREVAER